MRFWGNAFYLFFHVFALFEVRIKVVWANKVKLLEFSCLPTPCFITFLVCILKIRNPIDLGSLFELFWWLNLENGLSIEFIIIEPRVGPRGEFNLALGQVFNKWFVVCQVTDEKAFSSTKFISVWGEYSFSSVCICPDKVFAISLAISQMSSSVANATNRSSVNFSWIRIQISWDVVIFISIQPWVFIFLLLNEQVAVWLWDHVVLKHAWLVEEQGAADGIFVMAKLKNGVRMSASAVITVSSAFIIAVKSFSVLSWWNITHPAFSAGLKACVEVPIFKG